MGKPASRIIRFPRFFASFVLLPPIFVVGCSRGGPETVPVYGTVTRSGGDLPKICRLFFSPLQADGPLRPSATSAEQDGSYAVKAYEDADGLVPGAYRVRVSYFDLKPGGKPELETAWSERSYDAGELVVEPGSQGVEHNIEIPAASSSN